MSVRTKNSEDLMQACNESEESSSSISSVCDESHELIALSKTKDCSGMGESIFRERHVKNAVDDDSSCICRKPSKEYGTSILKKDRVLDDRNDCYPHLMTFKAKELPRYLTIIHVFKSQYVLYSNITNN